MARWSRQSSSMSRQEPLTRRAQPTGLASLVSELDMLTGVAWTSYGEEAVGWFGGLVSSCEDIQHQAGTGPNSRITMALRALSTD